MTDGDGGDGDSDGDGGDAGGDGDSGGSDATFPFPSDTAIAFMAVGAVHFVSRADVRNRNTEMR